MNGRLMANKNGTRFAAINFKPNSHFFFNSQTLWSFKWQREIKKISHKPYGDINTL
jgi:hypothetical protein